ncbi:MAG TPA: response regulator, partial [Candidatus Polarisedimenticolia bacterium]|nr:response regulator [Candidatus Polarisedimenticolia bacterium]
MDEPINILVVDDDPAIREVLSEGLTECGYRCDTAEDGCAALEHLRRSPCRLLISDVDMPRLDGVGLLKQVKAVAPDTAVILLTGMHDFDTALQSMRLGASDYLTKPFHLEQVRLTVERVLETQRLVRENREHHERLEARVLERTSELQRKTLEI